MLANFRKHSKKKLGLGVDAFSSATKFNGWRGLATLAALPRAGPGFHAAMAQHVVVSDAKTWLGGVDWRRTGLIGFGEAPRSPT